MTHKALDRLLATLDVQLHAFAVCEVAHGARLVFDPMDVIVVHYVLAGRGFLAVEGAADVPIAEGAVLVVPAARGQALIAGDRADVTVPAAAHCAAVVDGLLRFDAADGGLGELRTICATVTATYGGSFGLFDSLDGPIVDDARDIAPVNYAFELLKQERGAPGLGTHAITAAAMKICLIFLIRRHLQRGSTASPPLLQIADSRLLNAVSFVLRQPGGALELADLASAAGMSRTTFSKAFAEAFDETPMEFVQKTRLHRAAKLLATTELPIKLVAGSTGFPSRSHFSRAFRRAYGTDPTAYRKGRIHNKVNVPENAGQSWWDWL